MENVLNVAGNLSDELHDTKFTSEMRRSVATPTATSASSSSCCFICKSSEDNELLLGKFHKKWRIRVHYHCLLLTSNLVQNGEDEEGIFGFMEDDIRTEEARIRGQKCFICKERYANISCCAKKCFRTFHTVCGVRNGCLSHYADTFQSWCDKHVALVDKVQHSETEACGICYDEMGPYRKLESIRAPCCQNGWFHRSCVAQFAQSAGYFFKCPLCNNKDDFGAQMQRRGIYIPEKDASWELEPNAFNDQLERPSECDAEDCRCRYGRDYDDCKRWDLILCATCGSTCRHDQCMEVPSKNYVCTFCRPIVGNEPPEAVLKLAEASRREEAARRAEADSEINSRARSRRTRQIDSDDTDSDSSESESSPVLAKRKRKSQNRRKVIDNSDDDDGSCSDIVSKRKKPSKRRLNSTSSSSSFVSSNDEEMNLEEVVKKIPLPQGICVEKLLLAKPVVKIEKLSSEKIKTLTSSENEEDASSAGSSTIFDFNYRVKLNKKQRRKSMVELQSIKEVIRSDTDTLTDASVGQEILRPNTPAKKSFAKQFKLKLLGSKTVPRKRSTSESDPEQVITKKLRPSLDQELPVSKSRVALFSSNDEENTCPNSPMKVSEEPTIVVIENSVSPIPSSPIAPEMVQHQPVFPPTPPRSSSDSNCKPSGGSGTHQQQKTLNSFFRKTPPEEECSAASASDGLSKSNSESAKVARTTKPPKSGKKSITAKTPKSMRKKLVELDRSQRNLLDYFNRC